MVLLVFSKLFTLTYLKSPLVLVFRMIKSLLFFTLVLLSLTQIKISAAEVPVDCESLKDSCEYYSCFESKRKCGRF